LEYDLSNGTPILTTKKMFLRGIFEELKMFLLGKTNTLILKDKGINIWNDNTSISFLTSNKLFYKEGDMGPMYGYQWRHYNAPYFGANSSYDTLGYDQLANVIDLLKNDPHSRRILMSSYNPIQADLGVLYPCHGLIIQFYIDGNDALCCYMYQRSADAFLGLPFNITSYSLMILILANILDKKPGRLILALGDYHIYDEHKSQCLEQLKRIPYKFPTVRINKKMSTLNDINELNFNDLIITNYKYHDAIKANMVA